MKTADQINKARQELDGLLRKASVAEVGGFRPPDTHLTSWFGGRGVGLPGETLPTHNSNDMFPLLQVRTDELPYRPSIFDKTVMLAVFMNREVLPFDQPHGDGWLIREYTTLDKLEPLPPSKKGNVVKSFPIRWNLIENDAPCWENLLETSDWPHDDSGAFFNEYKCHEGTKIGGFPFNVQHGVGLKDYVFQIDSEYKAGWSWGDQGIGYFHKTDGVWHLDWQCL